MMENKQDEKYRDYSNEGLEDDKGRQTKGGASYRHVLKFTGLFGSVQVLTMLVGVLRNKLAALILGPSGLALITLYNNAATLINQATNFGISFSAIKQIAEIGDAETAACPDERGCQGRTHDTMPPERWRAVAVVRLWSLLTALLGTFAGLVLAPVFSHLTFGDGSHTADYLLLAPMVGMLALTSGEMAVLKGLKMLGRVARVSVLCAVVTLVVCIPLYYTLGVRGIAFALLLSQAGVLGVHLWFSGKAVSWRGLYAVCKGEAGRTRGVLADGLPMVKLGIAFVLAGICGQGAEYAIRALILRLGSLGDVGLYNSGYIIAVTYAAMVFTAVEADYFPRLSATGEDRSLRNQTVSRQTEVCVMLMSPFLLCFVVAMPLIIPLLFSADFVAAIPMAVTATPYMFFKALTLPAAYLPLARGESWTYMVMEVIYDAVIIVCIPFAYSQWGLVGTGWALAAAGAFDAVLIHGVYRYRYGLRLRLDKAWVIAVQFVLLICAVGVSQCAADGVRWGGGLALAAAGAILSGMRIGRLALQERKNGTV